MSRTIVALVVLALVLAVPALAASGRSGSAAKWDARHLPSPAPGYLPRSSRPTTSTWNAAHVPSPAPGYLPRTVPVKVQIVRVSQAGGFDFRDAAIGAAVGAFALAAIGGAVLLATGFRPASDTPGV